MIGLAAGWAAKLVGERFAKPAVYIVLALLIVGVIFMLGRCSKDDYKDDYEAQIEQTTASNNATVEAAQTAVQTLQNRTATEDAIDQAVEEAVKEIGDAADAAEVEAAVIATVCKQQSHRNDPACRKSVQRNER